MANLHESAEDEEPDDRQKELWKKEEGAGTDEEDGATASKEANAYEYSVDSVPYQASDYIENFYFEKGTQVGHNPLTPLPQTQENTCKYFRPSDRHTHTLTLI